MQPNTLTRRALLAGIPAAAVSTALAISIAPAVRAADVCSLPVGVVAPENPELVKLGNDLPAIESECRSATHDHQMIINEWWGRWPLAPKAIVRDGYHSNGNSLERGLTGIAILANGKSYNVPEGDGFYRNHEKPRTLWGLKDIDGGIAEIKRAMKRKRKNPFAPFNVRYLWTSRSLTVDECDVVLAELNAMRLTCAAYEAEKANVLAMSGYPEAVTRQIAATQALTDVFTAIMTERSETTTGILVKARALEARAQLPAFERMMMVCKGQEDWASDLGTEILRIASDHTAQA